MGNLQILGGILPENILWATSSCSNVLISPIDSGKGPINSLKLTSNTVMFCNSPISLGKQDLNPLFIIIISFRFSM